MKRGYVVGFLLVALCGVTVAFTLRGAGTPNVDFAQAKASGEACVVYGKLLKDSVQMQQAMKRVSFEIQEEKSGERLGVLYENSAEPVSANFASATHVRAVGIYDPKSGLFRAAQLYTKCPSKYDSGSYKEEKSPTPDLRSLARPK
jgi:cytochrome c-type biogenesis protein CcmE